MTDPYSPSPELVEAAARNLSLGNLSASESKENLEFLTAMFMPQAKLALTAAVAFRHPSGEPELVAWEQVRELVDAAQRADDVVAALHKALPDDGATDGLAPSWWELGVEANGVRVHLRAALTPFTQEPR